MSRYRSIRLHATAAPPRVSVESAIQDFLLYHERKGDSLSYLQELRSYLIGGSGKYGTKRSWKPLQSWAVSKGLETVSDLTKDVLGSYLDEIRSLATRSDYARVCVILKRLLNYWVDEAFMSGLPISIPAPKRFKAEIKVFTVGEMQRMQSVVRKENIRDVAIFMLLLDTGMRISELCNLRVDDIRFDRQELIPADHCQESLLPADPNSLVDSLTATVLRSAWLRRNNV